MPFDDDLDLTEKLTFSQEYVDLILRQSLTGNANELMALPLSQDLETLISDISSGRPTAINESAI